MWKTEPKRRAVDRLSRLMAGLWSPPVILKILNGFTIPFFARPSLIPLWGPPREELTNKNVTFNGSTDSECVETTDPSKESSQVRFFFFLSTKFLVPKPDGSPMPVLNLKRLNQFMTSRKFHLINHLWICSAKGLYGKDSPISSLLSRSHQKNLSKISFPLTADRSFLWLAFRSVWPQLHKSLPSWQIG